MHAHKSTPHAQNSSSFTATQLNKLAAGHPLHLQTAHRTMPATIACLQLLLASACLVYALLQMWHTRHLEMYKEATPNAL
jgi:hypothetical protein